MADLATLEKALRNADAAGDEDAARMFAQEITKMRSAAPAQPDASPFDKAIGSVPGRFVKGMVDPLIGVAQLGANVVGQGDFANKKVAELEAAKQRGMAAHGTEGFDWAGLAGSLAPGVAIAKGASLALPAAKTLLGRMGVGAATGAVSAGAQPIANTDDFATDKAMQTGIGGLVGGAIPAVTQGVKSFFGSSQLNPTQTATLQEGRAAGYTIPPSTVNPSGLNNTLESIAGKAAVGQDAAARNQKITNALTAKALGLPKGSNITEDALYRVRGDAGKAYQHVAEMNPGGELRRLQVRSKIAQEMTPGPVTGLKVTESRGEPLATGLKIGEVRDEAGRLIGMKVGRKSEGVEAALEGLKGKVTSRGQDVPGPLKGMRVSVAETRGGSPLEQLKQYRADSNAYFKHYGRSADPESLRKANELVAKAKAIEQDFEERAIRSGKPELIKELKEARELIAKTYDAERALNLADSNISAPIIGRQLDQAGSKGKSGEILTIGKMAEAFPSVMREGAKVPTAGVSGTDAAASAILGTLGYGAGGPAGLAAAALPLARPIARNLVLSPTYQKYLAQGMSPQMAAMIDAMTNQAAGVAGTAVGRNQ